MRARVSVKGWRGQRQARLVPAGPHGRLDGMAEKVATREVWLSGALDGFDPWIMPLAHALVQAREDIEQLAASVPAEHVWARPGGAASIGFHVRHVGGVADRLFTYARGEALDETQRAAVKVETAPGEPPASLASVAMVAVAAIDKALEQLRTTPHDRLLDERKVGRAGLPSSVLGLMSHAAEHATRHVGQAITTAKVLSGGSA